MSAEEKDTLSLLNWNIQVPERGKILRGRIVRVEEKEVFIDFGFKSEGIAPIEEFLRRDGQVSVDLGDEVEVVLESWKGEGGVPVLSKKRADLIKEFERLKKHYEEGRKITGKVLEKVKGGLTLDVGDKIEIKAFMPASLVDLESRGRLNEFLDNMLEGKIIEFSTDRIIVSRKAYLEEQREIQKKRTLSTIKEGKIVTGRVTRVLDYGAFVDLGGIEGFLHISDISWGRIEHPRKVISPNEEIRVRVLSFDPEEEKISVGLKQTEPDPWIFAPRKYKPGMKINGKVVSLTDFGAFVELDPGVEGLVHISEMSWTKKIRHPKDVVKIGSRVEVIVLDIDPEKKRISLSLRRVEPSPWEVFGEKNPPGTKVKGKVKSLTDFGAFIELGEGLDGLLRASDVSWKGRVDPQESLNVGEEVEVIVLGVDEEAQKISLGMKQLSRDPWEVAEETYKLGMALTGRVMDVKEHGIFLELEGGLEGYIRVSDFSKQRTQDLTKVVKIGDEIQADIIKLDPRRRRVNLSKKAYEERTEKERISQFLAEQGEASVKLGDVLGNKLKSLLED